MTPYVYDSDNPEVVHAVRFDDGEIHAVCPKCGPPYELDFDDWEWGDPLYCEECEEVWDEVWMADDDNEILAGSEVGDGGGASNDVRVINRIVIHCSATAPSMDIGVDQIRQWHITRGFSDVGYHRVIRRDGLIQMGRPESLAGAHAKGFNEYSLSCCLVGGVDKYNDPEPNFTREQWNALEAVIATWANKHPHATICGHRDLPGVKKACPSFDVATWLAVTFGYREES